MDAGIQEPVKEVAALAPAQEKGISAEVLHWVVGAISMLMMLALFTLAVVNTRQASARTMRIACGRLRMRSTWRLKRSFRIQLNRMRLRWLRRFVLGEGGGPLAHATAAPRL